MTKYEEKLIKYACKHCISMSTLECINFPLEIIKNSLKDFSEEFKIELATLINCCIYEYLMEFGRFYIINNIDCPKDKFKPLDAAYQCFDEMGLKDHYDLIKVKNINAEYKKEQDKFVFKIYKLPVKNSTSILWNFLDLENWQMLANLLIGSKTYWKSFVHEGVYSFRQVEFEEI